MDYLSLHWVESNIQKGTPIPYRATSLLYPGGVAYYVPTARCDPYRGGWLPCVTSKGGSDALWDLDYGPNPDNSPSAQEAIEIAEQHIWGYIERRKLWTACPMCNQGSMVHIPNSSEPMQSLVLSCRINVHWSKCDACGWSAPDESPLYMVSW
jgi:hypothetical protein